MKLSTKGRYGLRAMVDLAEYSEKAPVSIGSISQRQGLSERYLEQLVAKLKKAGLVESIRGAGGGYVVKGEMSKISVGDILRALEGDLEAVSCAAFHEKETCQAEEICTTKYVWQRINESIQETVDNIYLSQLVEESKAKKADHQGCTASEAKCNGSRS
nr:Rrf2 family transcriptional regulator [uncultured Sellimonas sp.]